MTKEPPVSFSSLAQPVSTAGQLDTNGLSQSAKTGIIVGTVLGSCAVITMVVLALLFWRRRKRRVLREQQMAIRRMTLVGPSPPSQPPALPYPFVGHGHRSSTFSKLANFGIGNIEIPKGKDSGNSGQGRERYPRTKSFAPVRLHQRDHLKDLGSQQTVAPSVAADSASLFSSKQSDIEDHRTVLVNGVHVPAIEREDSYPGHWQES